MDNDGALLEVLRNTYKGLRFRWKYRGLIILPAEQGNAAAADAIRAGQLVAVPTETVYGLAGNGLDPAAVSVRPLRCNRDAHRGRIFDREIYRENQG